MTHSDLREISDQEWDYTFRLNIGAYFYLVKAALPHMPWIVGDWQFVGEFRHALPDACTIRGDQACDRPVLG